MNDHARLFVAVRFPESVRAAVWDAMAPLRATTASVRWTPVEQLHITLRFLGNVTVRSIPAIEEGLRDAAAACAPFTLRLGGVGAFPSLRRPRVLWLGADSGPGLQGLYTAVEKALEASGFAPEERRFRAHVTLGRVRRGSGSGSTKYGPSGELARIAATVDLHAESAVGHLYLMRSRLSPKGAKHTVAGEYPLGGRGR